MNSHLPTVIVYNNLEAYFEFLSRSADMQALEKRRYRGDRALLWCGDPKLVFVTAPIPHADYLRRHGGYPGTRYLTPSNPSVSLSHDIMRDSSLLNQIAEYAGAQRVVQLIPYATTRPFLHLADMLGRNYGLTVILPESPSPDCLWVRDYIDTKSGFRLLVSRWLPDADTLLPPGVACHNLQLAAEAAHWLCRQGRACMIKADRGEGGLGHLIIQPDACGTPEGILEHLQANPFLRGDLIIVEEYIQSSRRLSPSLEFFVPPLGQGKPEVTYLSNQLFLTLGNFGGVLISPELAETPWYPTLARAGLIIAERLQAMGYVGHFDLDTVIDDDDRVFLLEVNSRRTGGTHVHEFACFRLGPDYSKEMTLLGHNKLPTGNITCFDELLDAIGDLLYPIQSAKRGVVITVTSALAVQEFGCILVAASTQEALQLQQQLLARLGAGQAAPGLDTWQAAPASTLHVYRPLGGRGTQTTSEPRRPRRGKQ